jgi:hypothetical protein
MKSQISSSKKRDRRIFRGVEVGSSAPWVVDLSPADRVDPDMYFNFSTRRMAVNFLKHIDRGAPVHLSFIQAVHDER